MKRTKHAEKKDNKCLQNASRTIAREGSSKPFMQTVHQHIKSGHKIAEVKFLTDRLAIAPRFS